MLQNLKEETDAYKKETNASRQRLEDKRKEQEKLAENATASVASLEKQLTCLKKDKSSAASSLVAFKAMSGILEALCTQMENTRSELSARFPEVLSS